jgi:hypothetical protein
MLLAGLVCLAAATAPALAQERSWFVEFEGFNVPPVQRDDVTQLVEIGTIDTDGFTELALSIGGEFRETVPTEGHIGALLIPDIPSHVFLLEKEGEFVFPLEVKVRIQGQRLFVSEPHTVRVAFPRYRVYLYNETRSTAAVKLYAYRSRCGG